MKGAQTRKVLIKAKQTKTQGKNKTQPAINVITIVTKIGGRSTENRASANGLACKKMVEKAE